MSGMATSLCMELLEHVARHLAGRPAVVDDAAVLADRIMTPFLAMSYILLCWTYILPLSQAFRSLPRSIAICLVTAPPILFSTVLLHKPGLDFFPMTLFVMTLNVGVPVCASSLVTRLVLGPKNSIKPNPLPEPT